MRNQLRHGPVSHGIRLRRQMRAVKKKWARQMRDAPTAAEALLWGHLHLGKMGVKFRRQALLRGYIVDFWCPKKRLVVELDGEQHYLDPEREAYDALRDQRLSSLGITVLRFPNHQVETDLNHVLTTILDTITNLS